jgi:hypothetical protein
MNVAVLAAPENVRELVAALSVFKELGVPAYGLKIRDSWEELERLGLSARIDRATHILLVCAESTIQKPWFVYSAGYSMGKGARLALFRLAPAWDPPPYLAKLPIIDGGEELAEYFRIEHADWSVHEEREMARSSLLELGVSFHADSLARCVAEGDLRAVELFLKAGFHPNSRDKHGVPLLCLAARNKHRSIAELLLEYGADIDLQSEDRGYSALMDATLGGASELVELFIDRGADPNLQSKDGQTALVVAVGRNDAATASLLLSAGADPDRADKLGLSARKYVALFKKPELVALFEPGDR